MENHIFPSRCPEKMVFPKISHWTMIFLVLSWKMIFLLPENMILPPRQKIKDDLSKKKKKKHTHGNMILSSRVLTRWSFQKNCTGTWSLLYYLERWYFFPKIWYFFFGRKMKDDFFQEIHGNLIFLYIYVQMPQARRHASLPKKMKDDLTPQKFTQWWLTS